MNPDRVLTEKEASEFLRIPQSTLAKQRSFGVRENCAPPVPFLRYGPRTVRYRLSDLLAYQEAHLVDPTNNEVA